MSDFKKICAERSDRCKEHMTYLDKEQSLSLSLRKLHSRGGFVEGEPEERGERGGGLSPGAVWCACVSFAKALAKSLEEMSFSEGELIFEEGEPGDAFYILIEGEVSVLKKGKEENKLKARKA